MAFFFKKKDKLDEKMLRDELLKILRYVKSGSFIDSKIYSNKEHKSIISKYNKGEIFSSKACDALIKVLDQVDNGDEKNLRDLINNSPVLSDSECTLVWNMPWKNIQLVLVRVLASNDSSEADYDEFLRLSKDLEVVKNKLSDKFKDSPFKIESAHEDFHYEIYLILRR